MALHILIRIDKSLKEGQCSTSYKHADGATVECMIRKLFTVGGAVWFSVPENMLAAYRGDKM